MVKRKKINKKRKIGIVTGSRAEYGYLKPLIENIKDHLYLDLRLYVSGTHLLKDCGETIKEIIKDGFKISKKIFMYGEGKSSLYDLAVSLGEGVKNFAKAFKDDKPDIIVVFGDRVEQFAAASAATALNIPIAHICGGEVALGDIDDSLRHAITKLSHLHFASTKRNQERILRLGEEKWRAFNAGALTLDTILQEKLLSKKEIFNSCKIKEESIILVVFHPSTTEFKEAGNQMANILGAALEVATESKNIGIAVICPNNYPGRENIIDAISDYQKKFERIYVFNNLSHINYLSLLSSSSVFVGNSSSGIIEAPSLGVPFISVGIRQKGREKGDNVIETGYGKKEITAAIKKSLFDKNFINLVKKRKSPYGDGKSSHKILKVLNGIKIDKKLLQKKITY